MLSNAYFLAKFRFDTAENEPAKNMQNFANFPGELRGGGKVLHHLQHLRRAGPDEGDPRDVQDAALGPHRGRLRGHRHHLRRPGDPLPAGTAILDPAPFDRENRQILKKWFTALCSKLVLVPIM